MKTTSNHGHRQQQRAPTRNDEGEEGEFSSGDDFEGEDSDLFEQTANRQQTGRPARTKRMLQTAEEAKAVGIANVEQLYLQGEQLERARKGVEHANQQLDTATWLLRGMHSYTGALLNYFSAPPLPSSSSASRTLQKKSAEERQNNNDDDEEDNWVIVGSSSCTSSSSSSSSSASSSSSLQPRKQQQLERTNEVEEQRGTRKKEAWENQLEREDDLSELHKAVSSLKELSLEAGNEVRRQNQQLDEYKDSLQGTRDKMKKNQKLLKERKRGGYLW